MFHRKVQVEYCHAGEAVSAACPLHWLDNFAMRNFTNDAIFDDTLPLSDGLLEIGNRVPIDKLHAAMDDWFRRKSYIKGGDVLVLVEANSQTA